MTKILALLTTQLPDIYAKAIGTASSTLSRASTEPLQYVLVYQPPVKIVYITLQPLSINMQSPSNTTTEINKLHTWITALENEVGLLRF